MAAGVIVTLLLVIVALATVSAMTAPYSPLPDRLHEAAIGIPISLVAYSTYRRFALRRPAAHWRIRRPTRRTIRWCLVGVAFPGLVLLVHLAVQDLVHVSTARRSGVVLEHVASSVAAGVLAGVVEEFAFRGYLLALFEERWGRTVAVAATSVLFAALHQGHAGGRTSLLLVLCTIGLAGVLLAVVVLRTGNVWNAVAVHAGWNAVLGGRIVSIAPAGSTPDPAVVAYRIQGGDVLLTGGEATISAAPVTIAALAVAIGVLVWTSSIGTTR